MNKLGLGVTNGKALEDLCLRRSTEDYYGSNTSFYSTYSKQTETRCFFK